ncbi:MAG: hypothetical protein IJ524_01555 [Bacteroidales bacterium]|nr:hypothetical protein [Bacteroidales bacterium]
MPKTIPSFVRKYRLPLLAALCLVPTVINVIRYSFHIGEWWPSVHYFVGYDTGFGGRKLIGTICGWLFPDYVTGGVVTGIVLVANLLLLLLLLLFVLRTVKPGDAMTPVAAVLVLYVVQPFNVLQFCNRGMSAGFMETYQLVLTLGWLLLFLRWRGRWWYYLLTLLVAAAGCLIHHTFCCTLFPLFVALFVYDMTDGGFSVKKAVVYGLICLAILSLFVSIWLFGHMNVDIDTLQADIVRRAAPDACGADKEALRQYYYDYGSNNVEGLQSLRIVEFVFSLLLMSPILAVFYWPWFAAARHSRQCRYWIVPVVITVLTIPVFLRTTDYTRWWICWFFGLMALLLVVSHDGNLPLKEALERMWLFFKRRWYLAVLLLVYAAQLYYISYEGLVPAIVLRNFLFGFTPYDSIVF